MTSPLQLVMAWLAARPLSTRVRVYNAVLAVAVTLAVLVWGLPLLDVDHIWRIDLDELGDVAIITGGLAALLAKANVRTAGGDVPDEV